MRKKKMSIEESWINYLCTMDMYELLHIASDRKNYCKEFVALAEEALQKQYGITKEKFYSVPKPDKFVDGEPGTRDLFLKTLKWMGFGRDVEFENDSMDDDGKCDFYFHFMGKIFSASATNDRAYAEVYISCCDFSLDDKEEIAIVKEAINKVNEEYIAKIFYWIDEEWNRLHVECCMFFLLIPLIRNLEIYLFHNLNYVIIAKQHFESVLKELKENTSINQ